MIHSVEEAAEPGRPLGSILDDGEGSSHGGGDGGAMGLSVELEKERKQRGERKGMVLGFAWGGECIGGVDVRTASTVPLVNRGRR